LTTPAHCWELPPPDRACFTLPPGEVHVWRVPLAQPAWHVEQLAGMLAEDERQRAGRFRFEQHRQRFVVGRGALRTILGCYLDIEPEQVCFGYAARGKPHLQPEPEAGALYFNLAHSHELALCALSRDGPIGIDLEYALPLPDADQVAARFFSAAEQSAYRDLPPEQRQEAFYLCWTRKEAYIKATGEGLARSLSDFDVSLTPGEPARLLRVAGDPLEAARWSLATLWPAPSYVAALAVPGHGWRLTCWQYATA
jgi:4'-phosphopantetheinyl transferase